MKQITHFTASFVLLLVGNSVCSDDIKVVTVFAKGSPSVYLDVSPEQNVIPALCGPSIADLRRCFQTMTGVPLPEKSQPGLIPIRVKLLPAEDRGSENPFGLQGYEVAVQSDGISLAAPTELGIVNAIFHLLDGWGCRWVMPGEIGEVIPRKDHLALPLGSQRYWPGSDSRFLAASGILCANDANEMAAWVRRNRMASQRWLTAQHYYNYAIPRDKYFKDHPEYYALIGGKRTPSQLCTSNPQVIELMITAAKTWFKQHPEVDSFPMDPNDNCDFCQCEKCVAQDPPGKTPDGLPLLTDRVIQFANEVACSIRTDFPDKFVALYAYNNHSLPPVKVKPESNVLIQLCRSNYCWLHLTADSPCQSSRDFYALIKAWKPLVRSLYLYEYFPIAWTGNLPCPNYLEFAKMVRESHALGVKGTHEDNSYSFANAVLINDYLGIRLKCLPQLAADEALNDLCSSFFGPASQAMKIYYQTMARVVEYTHPDRNLIGAGLFRYEDMFAPDILAQSRAALKHALDLAPPDSIYAKRVGMVDLGHRYLETYLEGIANAKVKKYQEAVAAFNRAEQLIDQMNNKCFGYSTKADAHLRIHGARLKFLAEYCPEQLGMITQWNLLGPFNNEARDADVTPDSFEPFRAIGGQVKLKDGREVKWRKYASPGGFLDFKKAFAADARSYRFSYAYAALIVKSPEDRSVQIRTDSFFPFRVYLNGNEVFYRPGCDADAPDKRTINVQLNAGENTIVFKCCQTGESPSFPWGLYMRITDWRGNPISDLELL